MRLGDRELVAASVDDAGEAVQRWATIIEIDRKERLVHLLCDDGTVTARRLPPRRRRR